MRWDDELEDYMGRIHEKAYARLMEEWPPEATYPSGSSSAVQASGEITSLTGIHTHFSPFADGHPASCEHMMEKLESVRQSLNRHVNDDITSVRITIGEWSDPVGTAFWQYLGDYETAVVWRIDYLNAMKGIADVQREVLLRTREDVRTIADAVLQALDQPVHQGEHFSFGNALTLAGAVAAVGLAVMDPLPANEVPLGLVLVNRITSAFGDGVAAADAISVSDIHGQRTVDILDSAYAALRELSAGVREQEDVVLQALTALRAGYEENEAALNPPRPEVDPNSVLANEIREMDPVRINEAGSANLPTIAGDNRAAELHTASIEENEPYAFEGDLHSAPRAQWQGRREDLQRVLGASAAELEEMAVTVQDIAATYFAGEVEQTTAYEDIAGQLEGP